MSVHNWIRKHPKAAMAILFWASYLAIYVFLSSNGRYTASSGHYLIVAIGLSDTDNAYWQPKWVRWDHWDPWTRRALKRTNATRRNFLSYVFAPLIRLDRAYWHPTYALPDNHTMPDARWTE